MKKSRIPKTITVGGYKYKVKYPYVFKQSDSQTGLHEPNTLTIKVAQMCRNQQRHWTKILETFLHETIHAVDCIYNAGLLMEHEIETLGLCLFQVLRENELTFDGSYPDTIKIGAFVYDIYWDFMFEDNDYMPAMIDHQRLNIYINPVDTNGTDINYDVQMSTLFYLVLLAIGAMTILQDGFECNVENTEEVAKCMVVSFANGLYKTIKDNNLVKLMKSNKDLGGK